MTPRQPTLRDDFFFDLQGFLRLGKCLTDDQLTAINEWIDNRPRVEPGEWIGRVHRQKHEAKFGENLQQIYEAEPFRCLIDHPAWIELVKRYTSGAFLRHKLGTELAKRAISSEILDPKSPTRN